MALVAISLTLLTTFTKQLNCKEWWATLWDISLRPWCQAGGYYKPKHFNQYINNFPSKLGIDTNTPELNVKSINSLLHADDLIIFSRTREGLQNKSNILDSYCKEWCLNVKPKLTKIMHTGRCSNNLSPFMVGDAELEQTSHYKYLDVEIDAHNKVTETIQNLCTRSWEAIVKLDSILPGTDIPAPYKLSLFDKLVKSILLYTSESWRIYWTNVSICAKLVHAKKTSFLPSGSTLPFETVHARFYKGALGVHGNIAVMDELGRLPMSISVIKAMLNIWQHTTDHTYPNATVKKATSTGCGPGFDTLKKIYNIFG